MFEPGPWGSRFVVTPLAALGCVPTTLLVRTAVIVQLPAGMLIPVKLSAVCPVASAAGVVPVHVPPTAWAPETCMLMSVSAKVPPVCGRPWGW